MKLIISGSLLCLINAVALMWSASMKFYPICFVNLGGIIASCLIVIRGFERLSEDNDDS